MTDSEILRLMRETPSHGNQALFDKYYSYVYAIVNRIIVGFGSPDDSEECVIDVFASVMMKLNPEEDCTLKAYIGTVARNAAISMRRSLAAKTGMNVPIDDDDACMLISDENIEENADRSALSELLLAKIGELGKTDSIIIIQKYYYNRTSAEIAKMLDMNSAAVRVRCGRAMKRLKKLLDEDGINL